MAVGSRILFMLFLVMSLTSCLKVSMSDVPSVSFGSQVLPLSPDVSAHISSNYSDFGSPAVFVLFPVGNERSTSTIRLSKSGGGSVSVHSAGRPASLLRGLDPALVNPAVLPFLFPSCDVPASYAGVAR